MENVVTWKKEDWFKYLFDRTGHQFDSIEKAGEGNMNLTLRLKSAAETIIVKHSPPYCAKYPHIPAPQERLKTEFTFYKTIEKEGIHSGMTPKIYDFDEKHNILLMEDLGTCRDFSFLYSRECEIELDVLDKLSFFLSSLHAQENVSSLDILRNHSMKKLNHSYIFTLPYLDKNFDLESLFPESYKEVRLLLDERAIQKTAMDFGEIYLNEGNTLLHGDFYPGSWLQVAHTIYVIDPEFCFIGVPEFDLSVTVAHLILANQPKNKITHFLTNYSRPFRNEYVNSFASLEIIRRLTYVAQLPLKIVETEKVELLKKARMVLNKDDSWF